MRTQFERQRATVLDGLDKNPAPAKGYSRKGWLDDLIDWLEANEVMAAAVAPLLAVIVGDTGQSAMQQVGLQPSQFDPYTEAIKTFFETRSTKIAKDVNAETEKQLRATLSEGIRNSEGIYELRARVEEVFGSAATYRADRIVRSETTRAQSFADIEAWDQSGVVKAKEWFTAEDEVVCDWCGPMNGTVINLREKFFEKGDVFYGANEKPLKLDYDHIHGPPLHVNCRCVLLPVLK